MEVATSNAVPSSPAPKPRARLAPRRASRPPRILSRDEVRRLVCHLGGTPRLAARLVYGGGLRLSELVSLCVADVDLLRARLTVRGARGAPDRRTLLPPPAIPGLERLLEIVRRLHARDLARGLAGTLADARRQWLFPSPRPTTDRRTGRLRREPLDPRRIERAIARAARELGLPRGVGCRTLRTSFAAHLLEAGWDPARVRELLGHRDSGSENVLWSG